MPNILVTICARGGSKGILGKNIKPVGGKPLIAYTIATPGSSPNASVPTSSISLSSSALTESKSDK